jgi:hypothetical protein
MKALISIIEPREAGYRVAQVVADNAIFPVAEPDLFWISCADNIVQDEFWYDPVDQTIKPNPVPSEPTEPT